MHSLCISILSSPPKCKLFSPTPSRFFTIIYDCLLIRSRPVDLLFHCIVLSVVIILIVVIIIQIRLKECVAQSDIIYPGQLPIIYNLRVNEEEHRHIHSLPGKKALLLKAEALDFVEI
mmetsp:Transcript_379/g.893  ORF Transcript_379/g.893 Transcript_379/m.893 type:complete len:118 (+) Transcript_379:164-517(+)